MIKNYLPTGLAVEPQELRVLQSAFDALKARLSITEQAERDVLGLLFVGAYNAHRDVESAQRVAEERYRAFIQSSGPAKSPAGS